MELASAMLCDAATVREGLLHILGGGITRLWRGTLPAPMNVVLAVQLRMSQAEEELPHEVRADIWDRNNKSIAQVAGAVQYAGGARLEKGEAHLISLVLPLQPVAVEKYGRHVVRIRVDDGADYLLPFYVLHPDEQALPHVALPNDELPRPDA